MHPQLQRLYSRVPFWKQMVHRFQAMPFPLRRKFFRGYDLDGNSYWEFYLERQQVRPRRIVEPIAPQSLLFNYFDKVPIQWTQWLRYARHDAPTPMELIKEEERIEKLQALAQIKDQEQTWNKALIDDKIEKNMYKEMDKLHAQNAVDALDRVGLSPEINQQEQKKEKENDPWKQAQLEEQERQHATVLNPKR